MIGDAPLIWTALGTIAATFAAVTGGILVAWSWRDRSVRLTVSVGPAPGQANETYFFVTARMQRGPRVVLQECGMRFRDGTRRSLVAIRVDGEGLPREVRAHDKADLYLMKKLLWEDLVSLGRGAEDVAVSFYVRDGLGRYYDWPDWTDANAASHTLRVPRTP